LTGFKEDVAMTPSFKVGNLEINGYSDGLLETSLDLVVNMERARSSRNLTTRKAAGQLAS
jgi:hypothetical protein